jgi:hypothetical protein
VLCHGPVDSNLAARVRIEAAGKVFWMPVIIRWVRREANDWTVGCAFDRPTAEKLLAIRETLEGRRRVCA